MSAPKETMSGLPSRLLAVLALLLSAISATSAWGQECSSVSTSAQCGSVGSPSRPVFMNEFDGPVVTTTQTCGGFTCGQPQTFGPRFRLAVPTCDPHTATGGCSVDLVVPLLFPGLQQMDCDLRPFVYWYASATVPPCPSFPCPGTACGIAGVLFDRDRAETWIRYGGVTCDNLGSQSGAFSFRARVCASLSCNRNALAENLTFPAQMVGEAIGCIDPPPPPKGGCGCACKPGGAGPGGRGSGAGPGSDGGGAGPGGGKGFGGAPLHYQAGGAGHPSYPGSVA